MAAARDGGCSVCGPGREVGNPGALLRFPGYPEEIRCDNLEEAGKLNLLPQPSLCSVVPASILEVCNCRPGTPTPAPTSIISTSNNCNVCRIPSYTVVSPFAEVHISTFLDGTRFFCFQLEQQAALGTFDETTCALLPDFSDEFCGGCMHPGDSTTTYGTIITFTPSYAPALSKPIGNYGVGFNGEEDTSNSTVGSYLVYLILGLASVLACVCLIFGVKGARKQHREERTVEITPALTLHRPMEATNRFEEAQVAVQLVRGEKLRLLVLQALFPDQKEPMAAKFDLEEEDDTIGELELCSICLERLEQKDSVIFGSSCAHVYHRDCIIQWLSKKVYSKYHDDCPNCRQRMWDPGAYEIIKENIIRLTDEEEQSLYIAAITGEEDATAGGRSITI